MNIDQNTIEALVLQIIRMSTEDGPGIRTTVFFKGCPLNCAWCHNPESISPKPQVWWVGNRCIGCRTCLSACPEGAICLSESGVEIDRNVCTGCGTCAAQCPAMAMELLGTVWELEPLVAEVIKDRAYFNTSGGGVTVSGGEPAMQSPLVALFLKSLREKGLHTALDTCGACGREALDRILPYAAMVLFDVKLIDSEEHQQFTGQGNRRILENLVHVAGYVKSHVHPAALWIRTPVIPGATDHAENIAGIGRFLSTQLTGAVSRWELCAFNNLCQDKYLRLGGKWQFEKAPLITSGAMDELADVAKKSGVDPQIVSWSGATRETGNNSRKEADVV